MTPVVTMRHLSSIEIGVLLLTIVLALGGLSAAFWPAEIVVDHFDAETAKHYLEPTSKTKVRVCGGLATLLGIGIAVFVLCPPHGSGDESN